MERPPWLPRPERGGRHRAGIVAAAAAAILVAGVAVAVFVYPGTAGTPSGLVRACAHANGLQAVADNPTWARTPQWAEAYAVAAESSGRATLADGAVEFRLAAIRAYSGDETVELEPWVSRLRDVCSEAGGNAAWAADFTPVWHCMNGRCDRGPEFIGELLENFDP